MIVGVSILMQVLGLSSWLAFVTLVDSKIQMQGSDLTRQFSEPYILTDCICRGASKLKHANLVFQ